MVINMQTIKKSLIELLSEFAAQSPDKRFLFTEDYALTAKQVYGRVCGIGRRLSEKLSAGDAAVLRATRCLGTAVLFYALQALGVTVVLTDPHTSAEAALKGSGIDIPVRAYITNEQAQGGISADGDWRIDGEPLDIEGEGEYAFGKVDVYASAVVIFTSGSTGNFKAVTLSQYNYLNHTLNYGYGGCYLDSDISMEMLPVHHVFGLAVLTTALMYRYELLFPREVTPQYIVSCLMRYSITRLDGVPSFANAVAAEVAALGIKTSLRVGVIGGAPVSEKQFSFIEDTLGLTLVPVYGMSECIGIAGTPIETERELRRTTVGVFLPMNEGRIGEDGEICVRSPAVMLGYWGDEKATRAAIDGDGWLHTGDLGYIDERGFLHVSGRKKDIIIRNGNNLSAVAIEQKILSLAAVRDVCVVGIPDESEGEVPVAAVVCNCDEGELFAAFRAVLPKNELPRFMVRVDAVPLTSSAKPDKQAVRAMFVR